MAWFKVFSVYIEADTNQKLKVSEARGWLAWGGVGGKNTDMKTTFRVI